MKNIVFLGSKDIGYKCLKHLFDNRKKLKFKLIGVLTNTRGEKVVNFCKSNSIKIINSLDEFLEIDSCDIAISIQYHEILKRPHIKKAKDIFVNLHMAPLPEYRGCNQFSFAIIDESKEFGTTIHRLEEGIDSGSIMFEKRFPIPNDCWVEELYQITFDKSVELFIESIPDLLKGNYKLIPQKIFLDKRTTSLHHRKEIEEIKKIDLSWEKEKIERHIRATSMTNFDPPYTLVKNKKINFVEGQ
ncbi:MAG: hypothetical protein CMG69_03875 [Candidatus Marinimicrobia bacterium]|nr:hypothetical protein [Candidatus Neomarinimicrobiota bacterium]|tara:strand:+ start:60237 stop:60968 length:732 start_codon:yes stop_codon:yes gene_type:complete